MDNFTNETIDINQLPKFEEVQFTALHHKYWNVVLIHFSIFVIIFATAMGLILVFNEGTSPYLMRFIIAGVLLVGLILLILRIGFSKKGFAFRTHDVLFRSGVISTNTMVIPYNRIQHVALHEGFISRAFGLATIQIFTAGGSSSDIEIPGILKGQAEDIKQLLMVKIQKQL